MERIIAGHSNTYHTYTFEDSIEGISAAGYKYIELSAVENWAEYVSVNDSPDSVKERLSQSGLEASAMSIHLDLFREESITEAMNLMHWAGEYGLPVVNTALASRPEGSGSSEEHIVDVLTRIAQAAVAAGTVSALEVHGDIVPNGAAVVDLLDAVGEAGLGLNYDTGNVMFYSGIRAEDELAHVIERVSHVHLKDKLGGKGVWHFPALGGGYVPFRSILDVLRTRGQEVPVSVELEFSGEPWPPLEVVNDAMRVSLEHLTGIGF